MLYFSQLVGKKIFTENNKIVGVLRDFVFLAAETSSLTKAVFISPKKQLHFISMEDIKEISNTVIINSKYKTVENNGENELYIVKNLLDKQIIDVKGGKVVRVNDVAIQDKDEEGKKSYYIAGVDVGFRAILRWVHLERPALPLYRAFGLYSHPHFLSWADIEPLELTTGTVKLKKEAEELDKMRPEDLADYLERTNIRNVNQIVSNLDEEFAANVIADLNVNYQTSLFRRFASEKGAKLIEFLDPDEAVDILLTLTKDKREEILNLLPKVKKDEVVDLIKYSKTPIGELINPEYISISSTDTAGSALEKVKNTITESHFSAYIYVVNAENELTGVIDLGKLIKQPADTPIHNIMDQNVVVIHLTTPKEIATKKLFRYKLYALPVIESNKKIIGIVTYDDLVEDIIEKL